MLLGIIELTPLKSKAIFSCFWLVGNNPSDSYVLFETFFQALQRHPVTLMAKQKFNLQGKNVTENTLKVNMLVYIASRTYQFCWQYAIMLVWKTWSSVKVSEYSFKENKNAWKIMQVLLYRYFYNISLNVLRPNFLNICNLPVSHFPNIRKIRVKVGPKTNYFSYFMSSCTDRIVVFNNFFSLIFSQPRDKQHRARNFLLFK